MIQEKDFLYRVPVKTAPITTPRGQIRNPEILVDLEGGEFMHGNILDANSTNKLINQSVKDAVDDKLNESGLQAAIATKADAAALSNYVLTTALNQQVDTLNTAISAKQDAGNYIPYDSTDTVRYKIDRSLKITENGLTGIIGPLNINLGEDGVGPGTFKVSPGGITQTTPFYDFSLNNEGLSETIKDDGSKFKISPSQILLQKDDNNLVKISSDGMQLKKDGSDFINIEQGRLMYTTNRGNVFIGQTSNGFQLNLTDEGNACYAVISGYEIYVKNGVALTNKGIVVNPGSSSPTYIYSKADATLGAENIIGGKVSDAYGNLRDGINKVQQKVTANTTALEQKQDKGNYIEYSSKDNDGYTIDCEFNTSGPITVDGGTGYLTYVTQSGIETHDSSGRLSNLTVTSLSIASDPTTRTTYTINGITTTQYKDCLATSDGTFKPISDFVLKSEYDEDIAALEARIAALEAKHPEAAA